MQPEPGRPRTRSFFFFEDESGFEQWVREEEGLPFHLVLLDPLHPLESSIIG